MASKVNGALAARAFAPNIPIKRAIKPAIRIPCYSIGGTGGIRVMPSRRIEQQLEALRTMRSSVNPSVDLVLLRKALADRVSVVVAKAASLVAEWKLDALLPDLCAAYERLFEDGARIDPQCGAKIALAE